MAMRLITRYDLLPPLVGRCSCPLGVPVGVRLLVAVGVRLLVAVGSGGQVNQKLTIYLFFFLLFHKSILLLLLFFR